MRIRLNPKLWSLSTMTIEGVVLSHEPMEVSQSAGNKLLQLRRSGIALVVVAEEEVPPEPIFADEAKPKPATRKPKKADERGDDPS